MHRPANAGTLLKADMQRDLYQQLWNLNANLRDVRDIEKVLKATLRLAIDIFQSQEACVAKMRPGQDRAEVICPIPRDSLWDQDLLTGFLRGQKRDVPANLMFARIRRRQRMWGLLVLRNASADFRWDARQAFSSVGAVAGEIVDRIDGERTREVRARIDKKVLEQTRPKHLFYEILHGIRSLAAYDHSAALLTCDDDASELVVVAEQIAWRKAKSEKVGLTLRMTDELKHLLASEVVFGFQRKNGSWSAWNGSGSKCLAELLDYNQTESEETGSPPEREMLCAPLVTREGALGVLKVSSVHGGTLGHYEAELISQFLPHASVALQNASRTESLAQQVLAAERKHAMADLARGVSHDVNNALGAMLPLVQQMSDDLRTGEFKPDIALTDLSAIEDSLQVCRRIFGGMLSFARGATRNPSKVHLDREIDCTLGILRESLDRVPVEVRVSIPQDLPPVRAVQADVEQLLLNLLTNARDAMQSGDILTILATEKDGTVELTIADTGCGIVSADLKKIQEPFFTTKSWGTGLGLAICRSIVSQMRGRMQIDSQPGRGTRVTLALLTDSDRE